MRVSAWELSTGTVQRTYSCDVEGGGSAVCLLGKEHLMCALRKVPFIYVWNIRKVEVLLRIYECRIKRVN